MVGKDYLIQLRVKNGPMMRALRASGYESMAALARAAEVGYGSVVGYMALKDAPASPRTVWKPSIMKISACLGKPPEDLFPPQHISTPMPSNKAEVECSLSDIEHLCVEGSGIDPEKLLTMLEDYLPKREFEVVCRRFGLTGEEETYGRIGDDLGVTAVRVRQIQATALRRLRHPNFSRGIREQYMSDSW